MKFQNKTSRTTLWIGAVSLLLLTSCAKDDWNWLIGTPINVVAISDKNTTRSAADIQTGNFEAGTEINAYYSVTGGDAIGHAPTVLTASAPDANGKNILTPDVQPYYPQSGTVDLYALYPTDPSVLTNESTSFTVQADQSSDANYKLSDLMWAGRTAQAKTENDVELTFSHLMSKIVLDVTAKEGVTISSVKLTNVQRTINFTAAPSASTLTLGAIGTETAADKKTITIGEVTNGATHIGGAALFPPQTIAANFIEVVTKDYGTALYSVNKTFESGKQYTVKLTVTRQQIGCTTTITDWKSDVGSIAVPPGSSAGLKITAIPDQEYDGTAKTPPLTITYTPNAKEGQTASTYTLTSADYDVEFFNNTKVGTATVIISGKQNSGIDSQLSSSISKIKALTSFNITTATGNIAYDEDSKTVDYVYYGTVTNVLKKNGGDGNFTYSSSKENVATVDRTTGVVTIKGVGTTTITANMDDQGNYTAASSSYTLTVNPRKISTAVANGEIVVTSSVSSVPYTGQQYTPAVTVTDKGRMLEKGVHYNATYTNNTNHGTATITIKGEENGVYDATDTYKTTTSFTITQAPAGLSMTNGDNVTLPIGFKFTRKATTKFGTIKYSSSDNSVATVTADGIVEGVAAGTATITAYIDQTGVNGNYTTPSLTYTVEVVQSYWSYGFTGEVKSWTCPLTGIYKLEAFGAQGGTCGGFNGGRGAYIAGQLRVEKDQVLYIYVGQAGKTVTVYGDPYGTEEGDQGGWNGGGYFTTTAYTSTTDTKSQHNFCGGGGATDFALSGGAAWNTTNHMNTRILVAGGGGGALYREYDPNNYKFTGGGGGGGAPIGETGYGGSKPGNGGTLTAGGSAGSTDATAGSFGYGGNYAGTNNTKVYSAYLSAGMGGGGWFGGGSGGTDAANEDADKTDSSGKAAPNLSRQGAGGGGSSYIWSSVDKYNGETYASKWPSNVTKPDTKFQMTLVGFIEGARSGNGEARITYMGAE